MKFLETDQSARATRVRIDNGWVCVRLQDGREIRFPAEKNKRLSRASAKALKNVEIICNGTGLHWPDVDEDLSVQGILEGRIGQPEELLLHAGAR
ncbi:MAG: DUF2442 domain-containing protein [bacterium]